MTFTVMVSHKLNMGCLTLGSCINSFEGSVPAERKRERELCDVKMEMGMSVIENTEYHMYKHIIKCGSLISTHSLLGTGQTLGRSHSLLLCMEHVEKI